MTVMTAPAAVAAPVPTAAPAVAAAGPVWQPVCALDDIWPDTGVCALLGGRQIAIFRLTDDSLYAIDNHDPTALVGLPLIATCRLLRQAGFVLP